MFHLTVVGGDWLGFLPGRRTPRENVRERRSVCGPEEMWNLRVARWNDLARRASEAHRGSLANKNHEYGGWPPGSRRRARFFRLHPQCIRDCGGRWLSRRIQTFRTRTDLLRAKFLRLHERWRDWEWKEKACRQFSGRDCFQPGGPWGRCAGVRGFRNRAQRQTSRRDRARGMIANRNYRR